MRLLFASEGKTCKLKSLYATAHGRAKRLIVWFLCKG